jgi:hypothetical protein
VLDGLNAQIESCFNFLSVNTSDLLDLLQDSCDSPRLMLRQFFSISSFSRIKMHAEVDLGAPAA